MAAPTEWFNRGEDKLTEAKSEFDQGRYENAFQAAREAAENFLKALLVAQGLQEKQFMTHDDEWLCQQICWSKFPHVDRTVVEQASQKLAYFTMESGIQCSFKMTGASRYPQNIAPGDATRTIQIAGDILSEVQKEFNRRSGNVLEKRKIKAEARSALLRHYTDQLVSHAALLFTLAVPTLTALHICLNKDWVSLSAAILFVSLATGAWLVCRFLYHTRMAGHIIYRKPIPINQLESFMEKRESQPQSPFRSVRMDDNIIVESEPTEMFALYLSADYFDRQ